MAKKGLSRKEKLAAITGGMIDDSIPVRAWAEHLRSEHRHSFNLDPIVASACMEIAIARGISVPGEPVPVVPPRLEPAELRQQAREFAESVDSLLERIEHLHPELEMYANEALSPSLPLVYALRERLTPDLLRLRAAIAQAGQRIPMGKTGPKSTLWSDARDALARGLIAHSTPAMTADEARPVAEVLLELCGLKSPRRKTAE